MSIEELLQARGEKAAALADALRAWGDSRAARRNQWADAFAGCAFSAPNITAQRATADSAVSHLDGHIEQLQGDIEAMRVELEQIDTELKWRER